MSSTQSTTVPVVTLPEGTPIPELAVPKVTSLLSEDRKIGVLDLPNATLRHLATQRTPSGRLSADARRAGAEVSRRKANRAAKAAAAKAEKAAEASA